jgi:uncharacterized protein with von Willebrand factor type A (vWA) domain
MKGFVFSEYKPDNNGKTPFERLFNLFVELLHYTSGDATEALDWLTQLDRKHRLTDDEYGIGNFIEDLKQQGYLQENEQDGAYRITGKTEQTIRKRSLDEIFGKLKKSKRGNHHTFKSGMGDEINPETRPYELYR